EDLPFPQGDHWTYPPGVPDFQPEDEPQPHLLIQLAPEVLERFTKGYHEDAFFKQHVVEKEPSAQTLLTPSRFQRGNNGLLYFINADWQYRLCVPRSEVNYVLSTVHDSPFESAHAG
ncbi:hypothetical protein K525DRAFT_174037, partial [Schizophyllum commune Loenen D]